jgi:ParB/RepB/Spo0J family partition protein
MEASLSKFFTLPVDKVYINRAERQRRDLGDLTELKASIQRRGLINPIVVHEDTFELVAGERRLSAIRELGHSHIQCQSFEGLTPIELEQVELDENIHRLELPWRDKVNAIARYHRLCQQTEGTTWTSMQTADRLGLDGSTVRDHLRVYTEFEAKNQRVLEAPKFSVAVGLVERADARKRDVEGNKADAILDKAIPGLSFPGPKKEPAHGDPATVSLEDMARIEREAGPYAPILNASFLDWANGYSGPKYNLLHCDFPYGINAGSHDQGAGAAFGQYDDSVEVYNDLLDCLEDSMETVVAPAAHMIFWFANTTYHTTKQRLMDMGWTVNPVPLIWHRSDNSGILPDPKRGPRQVYEWAFLCTRGDRFIVRAKSNVFPSPSVKEYHMSEKPKPMLQHFMEMLVDETTSFLDPTCGSANSCIVAKQLGAGSVLGLEISAEFYENAVINWRRSNEKAAAEIKV